MNSEPQEGEMDIQEPQEIVFEKEMPSVEEIYVEEIYIERQGAMEIDDAKANVTPKAPVGDLASGLVRAKQHEYTMASRRFRYLYWATRLVAGLASGLLPFVVSASVSIATGLSVAIVISVVIDSVFDPKSRHQLYSRASDLLGMAQLKAVGNMDAYKEQLDIIVATEGQRLERLVDLEALIKKIGDAPK